MPLDSDGFLRRECPTCEQEFKWSVDSTADDEAPEDDEATPDAGYFCPYCSIQAPPDAWFTKAQLEMAEAIIAREFVAPELQSFKQGVEKKSGGLLDIEVDIEMSDEPNPLTETDDMRRVDFTCHPEAAVKVADDWRGSAYCRLCGTAVDSQTAS